VAAEKSSVGPEDEGIPISISASGEVVRTPRIDTTTAETTVMVADGQTVVLGGLITKQKSKVARKIPMLSDLPILGVMFRYDIYQEKKTELMIILTPRVIRCREDAELIKQTEAARMSWCLCDVMNLAEDSGLRCRFDEWSDAETQVIYPDLDGNGQMIQMPTEAPEQQPIISTPEGAFSAPEAMPSSRLVPQPSPAMSQEAFTAGQAVTNADPNGPWLIPGNTQAIPVAAASGNTQPQPYPSTSYGQPTAYQQPAAPAAAPAAGSPAIQLGYNVPVAPQQQPVGPPMQQLPATAAQPVYYQPAQQPVAQPGAFPQPMRQTTAEQQPVAQYPVYR
jgi:hypothetical protein